MRLGQLPPLTATQPFFAHFVKATFQADQYNKRRMSDTNLASKMYYKYAGYKGAQTTNASGDPVRKSQSEADYVNQYPEVEANSIDDGQRFCTIFNYH